MSNIYECYCLRAAIFNYMSESEKERVGLNKFIKIGGEKVSLYIRKKKNHKSFQISIYTAHNKTQYIVLKITYIYAYHISI